jgi:hypothetical protein
LTVVAMEGVGMGVIFGEGWWCGGWRKRIGFILCDLGEA